MNNLTILRELTNSLPLLEDTIKKKKNNYIDYDAMDGKEYQGRGIYKSEQVAIQRVVMERGTEIPEHNHKEMEYIIVVSGKFELQCEGKPDRICQHQDCMVFDPMVKHSGLMLEDTEIIAVVIPAGEGYPDA